MSSPISAYDVITNSDFLNRFRLRIRENELSWPETVEISREFDLGKILQFPGAQVQFVFN
jgi:hypothetical protein